MGVLPPQQHAAFVCQRERVLDVYQRPYEAARPVGCLDESPKQLLGEGRAPVVLPDGRTRYDSAYHRHGVGQLYRLHEPLRGWRRGPLEARHDRLRFARGVARLLAQDDPTAARVTRVLDHLWAHQPAALYEVLAPERAHALLPRIAFVVTPKQGSWLPRAEIEFAALLPHGLPDRVPDQDTFERHCAAWQSERNQRGAPTNWPFTTEPARTKLKPLYPTT